MDTWPNEGFREVGKLYMKKKPMYNLTKEIEPLKIPTLIDQAMRMHFQMSKAAEEYNNKSEMSMIITPCSFLNLIESFKYIYDKMSHQYNELLEKYKRGLSYITITEDKVIQIQEELN